MLEREGALQIRIQPRGGTVRHAVTAKVEGTHLLITVSSATAAQPEVKWDLTASGAKLSKGPQDRRCGERTIGSRPRAGIEAGRPG